MERRKEERRQGDDRREGLSYLSVQGLASLLTGDRRQIKRREEDRRKG